MNAALLFAALIGALVPGPKAPVLSADEKAIKAVHSKLLVAINAKNADGIKSLFTKGFTQIASGATFNRDQAVSQMTSGPGAVKVEWSVGGLKVSGNKAAYTSNFKFVASVPGQDGKTQNMTGTGVQKVHMVKERGKWLYNHLEVLSLKMTMNGKPLNP
jgi:hypothetical protein